MRRVSLSHPAPHQALAERQRSDAACRPASRMPKSCPRPLLCSSSSVFDTPLSLLVISLVVCAAYIVQGQDLDNSRQIRLIHAETNLLELVEAVLPPYRRAAVWSSEEQGVQASITPKRWRKLHKHHHRHGVLAASRTQGEHGAINQTGLTRERRSPQLEQSGRRKVVFLIQNAFPKTSSVDLSLVSALDGSKPTINNMLYGDWRTAEYPLNLDDLLVVSSGDERYSQTIRNKIRKVPLNAESFIVPDETEAGRLHSSITIYDIDVTFEAKNAWLMVYNALVQPKDKPRVFHGVDVIIFDASKYNREYSLHRIAKNVSLHKGQESLAPEGNYELKVIPHGQAADVDQFKNAESLLPPIYIQLVGGKRHYVTFQGILDSSQFPPQLASVPPIQLAPPRVFPKTSLIALNAFGGHEETSIIFPKYNITINVPSGRGVEEVIHLKRGDTFSVTIRTGQRHGFTIDDEVPYSDGECALIPDRGKTGQLEAYFGCWYRMKEPLPKDQFWIFVYHAMLGYDKEVDWIVYDESAMHDANRHSLFSLADNLKLTQGVASRVDLGNYTLKVVPKGTVHDPASFKRAESLIEPVTISPRSATRYYAAIQGTYGQTKGVFTSYPAMPPAPKSHSKSEGSRQTAGGGYWLLLSILIIAWNSLCTA